VNIVFVHGAGCTGDVFFEQTGGAFESALALTLPGHTTPGAPASIEEFADAVEAEIAARGLRDVVLCGHSMGGAVTLELALRRSPALRGVVLFGSGARLRVAQSVFDMLEADFEAATRSLPRYFFAEPTPQRIDDAAAMMRVVGKAQTLRDFTACNAFDRLDRLEEVALPLLAVTGERDVMTPPKFALALADRIPGAQARIIPGAGHTVMSECPADVNDALRAFVMQVISSN
jgi:3-oxoadipate enol-lactonase